jgi:hypothetical protein
MRTYAASLQLKTTDNIENQAAFIQAQAAEIAVMNRLEGQRSEMLMNQNSLLREQNEITKGISIKGRYKIKVFNRKNELVHFQEFENIVPNVALSSFAKNLVTLGGSLPASDELRISYVAVGTGTSTPLANNTTLETEVFRGTIDSQTSSAGVSKNAILIGFSEANGNTLTEVGAFSGSASGTVDTGTLMSRALFPVAIVKDNTKAIFIEISHTFSNA